MMFSAQDVAHMEHALKLANKAAILGEVPVGAVLVLNNQVIGEGFNHPTHAHDASAHAEVVAIRQAGQSLKNYRLLNTTLYVTLEPCMMCVGALVHARVARVIYGASDPKTGAVRSICQGFNLPSNHRIEHCGGLLVSACGAILSEFFQAKRAIKQQIMTTDIHID